MAAPSTRAAWAMLPAPQRSALDRTADLIAAALPGAEECIAWGMPTFRVGSDNVISLSGFAQHNSLFPGSEVAITLAAQLRDYTVTKGTIHFDRDAPFPAPLLRRIVKVRIDEINASYPRASGLVREYYDNGWLKAEGKVKDGDLHGRWSWYRRDGSLLRTGQFRLGTQVGDWTTYTRDGTAAKTTSFPRR